jgi:Reverse transcriptase (RNA-dependent DNA polymerase)
LGFLFVALKLELVEANGFLHHVERSIKLDLYNIVKAILKRLQNFITADNVLPNHQFGFRAAHSVAHQLRKVVKNVKDAVNSIVRGTSRVTLSTGMLLLDVEKASDSVWHKALLHKLLQRGFDIFLASFLFY